MIVCGKNAVLEALRSSEKVFEVWVNKSLAKTLDKDFSNLVRKKNAKLVFVDKNFLDKKTNGAHHQGFALNAEDYKYCEVEDILSYAEQKGQQPFVVILDKVEDPHNLGSVVRVCECAGVHGIIIPKHNACEVNHTVTKTSAGAISYVKIAKVSNLNNAIEKLKKNGLWIYGVELGGEDFYSEDLRGPVAIVIGSEGYGTSELVKKNCDKVLTLPMFGKVNSLNASVACGIAVFEVIRQRRK